MILMEEMLFRKLRTLANPSRCLKAINNISLLVVMTKEMTFRKLRTLAKPNRFKFPFIYRHFPEPPFVFLHNIPGVKLLKILHPCIPCLNRERSFWEKCIIRKNTAVVIFDRRYN